MAYSDINNYLREIKKEKDEKLKPENIKRGIEVLGVTGTHDGIVDLGDANATPDDVISPKVFYNKDGKQVGQIQTQIERHTGGMDCYSDDTAQSYWVADINDKYNIAVVYVYNQQNPWWIYRWNDGHLGNVLLSLNAGTYPNGTLTKNVSISKEKNSQGYLNIWSHAVNSAGWSDDMKGYIGVLQYDVTNNRIITSTRLETSKPGGYTHDWNEDGNMSPCPTDPSKCFVAYHNKDRIYLQMLVYNNVTNSLSRQSLEYTGTAGPSYQSEWNEDGTFVLMSRGAKSHPNEFTIIKINPNNTIQNFYRESNSKPSTIYKHYVIIGNSIYNFETGTKVFVKQWKYYRDLTNGTGIMWTYLDYLFVVDYNISKLYCFHIGTDLELTPLFTRQASTYVGSSYNQYMGTTVMPSSNSFLYFSPTRQIMYKFMITDEVDKIVEVEIQGEKFGNLNAVTATDSDVLLGKVFLDKNGENVGSMPNNGTLLFTPKGVSQTIPKGYTDGGTIEAVSSKADINIIPENIRNGVTILGVDGTFEGSTGGDATSDANIQAKYLLEGYKVVSDGKLIVGTMRNYGLVDMQYAEEEQVIPTGYYDELYISSISPSALSSYNECLESLINI